MNIVGITGNLTKDIELRYTQGGTAIASFCVAVKRPHTSDKTDFVDCIAFKNTAEFISKYFGKGSGISVDGYITTRVYEDKEGKKRKSTEVICQNVGFMGKKTNDDSQNDGFHEIDDDDGELPF